MYEIEVSPETYDLVFYWRDFLIKCLVFSLIIYYILLPLITPWLNNKLLYPALAYHRKGVWARNSRYWAHAKMLEEMEKKKKEKEKKTTDEDENKDEDDECPDLIPIDDESEREQKKVSSTSMKNKKKVWWWCSEVGIFKFFELFFLYLLDSFTLTIILLKVLHSFFPDTTRFFQISVLF